MSRRQIIVLALVPLLLTGCGKEATAPADPWRDSPAPARLSDLPGPVRSFIERKEQDVLRLARALGVQPDEGTREYFRCARAGQYRAASRIFQDLRERGGKVESPRHDPNLRLPLWDPLLEVQLALEAYAAGAGSFATTLGEGIAASIPRGSIYFGGTDTGRGLAAAFAQPRDGQDSFFVLTQNQLNDRQHLDYLQAAYGSHLRIPTGEEQQRCFQTYLADARRRYEHDRQHPGEPLQLRPGENVKVVDGLTMVEGQVAVMMLNGLMAKFLFEQNRDREFFVEESFPLDWMYPHLMPHGYILKLEREPLPALPLEAVSRDREFWRRQQTRWVGGWLTPETPVRTVCEFVERVHLRRDLGGFEGDVTFVQNRYARAAFAKLRVAQAGVYAWRVSRATQSKDRQSSSAEADFAFRQSFAFDPGSPETLFRYVNLLVAAQRMEDALLVARTALALAPQDSTRSELVQQLERLRGQHAPQNGKVPDPPGSHVHLR